MPSINQIISPRTMPSTFVLRLLFITQLFCWVGASPRVCQILLGKSCVLPTYKKMSSKKSPSPTVWHIDLPNPDLIYIRNLREKHYVMLFHLLKSYIRNPEIETNLVLCPSTSCATEGCAADTRAHMRAPKGGKPSCYWCQVVLPNCWRLIFHVLLKLDGCQAKIANCWSWSNVIFLQQQWCDGWSWHTCTMSMPFCRTMFPRYYCS
jgi:hypothetical protein